MKQILLIGALLINALLFAQRTGELAFFSNTGEKFYVVLNGIRQNITPETNVKVTGLTNPYYACKIVAANNSFTIEKNVMVSMDTLVTYQIIGKKGKYKLRGYSQTALNVTPADPNQTVIVYHPTENTGTTNVGTTGSTGTTNVGTTGTTETVTTTTTVGTTGTTTTVGTTGTTGNVGTTTTVGTTGTTGNVGTTTTVGTTGTTTTVGTTGTTGNTTESVNININVTENGMGINMNATGTGTGTENMNSSTNVNGNGTTTVTTSSSTTGGNGTTTYYEETTTTTTTTTTSTTGNTMYADPDMTVTMTTTGNVNGTTGTSTTGNTTTTTNNSNVNTTTNYNNCYMSDADFAALKKSIQAESFSEDQLRVANMAAKNKCMSVAQIKEIMALFSFSAEQLSFAKAAYDNCTNKSDYYLVMDSFTYSSDKEELENYINSKK